MSVRNLEVLYKAEPIHETMAVRTTGAGGARAPLTSKAGALSPPKKDLSVPKLIHVFNGLQCYTCINPMIMVKLTSKGQKSMFERVKNRKKILGGRVPGPPRSTCVFIARRAPLTFFIFLRPCTKHLNNWSQWIIWLVMFH